MSLKPRPYRHRANKPKRGQASASTLSSTRPPAPPAILTSHDLKQAHNHRAVPTVVPRGIVGTYTFPAPPGYSTTSAGSATSTSLPGDSHVASPAEYLNDDSPHADDHTSHVDDQFFQNADELPSDYHLKATRQTDKWSTQVIPSLVPIYLHLLRTTQSLTRPPAPTAPLCTCGGKATTLDVLCLYFDCKSY